MSIRRATHGDVLVATTTTETAMFKDILVPTTGTPGDADAIRIALSLASGFDAHLAVLQTINLPLMTTGPWGLVPDTGLVDIYRQLRTAGERDAAALRQRLARELVSTEVRVAESLYLEPHRLTAHCAHYADLAIVASAAGTDAPELTHAYVGALLLESGRPVLAVPPGCKATMPPRRIVAAWKPTREAARAFHDAMPLFQRADRIDIVIVNPSGGERGHGELPGADIATHLLRHGVEVDVVVLPAGEDTVADELDRHVRDTGADLLVAGGYGHSRFLEWALGGATRQLLESASVPVLFSH
jgi:nucleotide-binding universal stress UspA family protein